MPRLDFVHVWDESESVQFAHARKHNFDWYSSNIIWIPSYLYLQLTRAQLFKTNDVVS